jgi:hypothetical protein
MDAHTVPVFASQVRSPPSIAFDDALPDELANVFLTIRDQPPVVAQPRPEAPHIPDDLSVPDFLKRERVPQEVAT